LFLTSLSNLQIYFFIKKNPEEFELREKFQRLLCVNAHLFPCVFVGGAGTETLPGEFVWLSLDVLTQRAINFGRMFSEDWCGCVIQMCS